ncbi:MAG: DUF881 domain-containing protein [Mycobacteriaceae bacterium]
MKHAPERPAVNPRPALLTMLQSQHLDPGYAAAAQSGGHRHRPRTWLAIAGLLVGAVLGVAVVQAVSRAPDTNVVRAGLASDVRAARDTQQRLSQQESALAEQAERARTAALAGNAEGRAALATLDQLSAFAGASRVSGPGVVVTLTDSSTPNRFPGRKTQGGGTVLDRDLQQVVNSLWAAGAEAVAVGGVRLDPLSTIRQAGGAMLVNSQPIAGPYTVTALGNATALETGFVNSDAYRTLTGVAKAYGIGFAVVTNEKLQLPAAMPADLRFAVPEGPR